MISEGLVQPGRRLMSLEVGRGIAALLVVLYHYGAICAKYFGSLPSFNWLFRGGHAGVEYFFVLSGFIIYFIHQEDIGKPERFINFFKKRAIRILPMYWIILTVILIAFLADPAWGVEKSLSFLNVVRDYLLLPRGGPLLLMPAWTLEREFLFYAIFSISILLPRLGLTLFLVWQMVVLGTNIGFLILDAHPNDYTWFLLGSHNFGFIVGVTCAWFILRREAPPRAVQFLLIAIGAAGVVGAMAHEWYVDIYLGAVQSPVQEVSQSFIYTLSFGLIIFGLVAMEQSSGIHFGKYLSLLGASSYTLYLIHEPFASFTLKVLSSHWMNRYVTSNSAYVISVLLVLVAAIMVHLVIEKPVTRYLRKSLFPRASHAQENLEPAASPLQKVSL